MSANGFLSRRYSAGAAACSAIALLAGCGTSEAMDVNRRARWEQLIADQPGVPLVLPKTLPAGYRFVGAPEGSQTSPTGPITMREAYFGSTTETSKPVVVGVCVTDEPTTDICGADKDDATVARTVGSHRVLIRFVDSPVVPEEVRSTWESVPLTADLSEVTWLR